MSTLSVRALRCWLRLRSYIFLFSAAEVAVSLVVKDSKVSSIMSRLCSSVYRVVSERSGVVCAFVAMV